MQNEIENTDGKQNSEEVVTEKEIEDDKQLEGEKYIVTYFDTTLDMRYEYFYDGEYFYFTDNLGGYYRDGVLIRWNGKWGEEYEVTALQYVVDWENGNLVERILDE